ncbi:MAG: hypothetical protein JNL21_34520 [Myxococcales bacterium]|nr:hypothetical protein [Myxococcales bacterium]
MSFRRIVTGSFGLAAFSVSLLAMMGPGCGDESATEGEEQDVVPEGAQTPFDLAGLCDQNITRHAAVRAQELAEGVVRWQCGDRPGVDGPMGESDGRGQEYCEYHAISNGKAVTTFAEVDPSKKLYCYFTSVYMDVSVGDSRDKYLATELSKKENFGVPFDATLVRMDGQFNSRGAATTLVVDAMGVETDKNEDRQAACYLASVKYPDKAEKLKKLCRGVDLSKKSAWDKVAKLGAKVPKKTDAAYDQFKDLTACMTVDRLEHGGVDWRMSDPHISQVVVRANQECGCTYNALPDALEGFFQGTWSSKDALPPGCRRAKVGGQDYQQLTICEVPDSERGDLEINADYSENLLAFCNDRFGKDIVMTAPLRAVENAGSCTKSEGAFCSEFTKTAAK